MTRLLGLRLFPLFLVSCFAPAPARPQSVELRWTKTFPKDVSWYTYTSGDVLLVGSGKTLIAVNSENGRQLWQLEDFHPLVPAWNLFEMPGMGAVIVNDAKIPGFPKRQLVALNLLTGERLWNQPQIKALMIAVPMPDARHVLLAALRAQRKAWAKEAGIRTYPFRFSFQLVDLLTGQVQWAAEYPHIFALGAVSLTAFGDHLFIYYGNSILGCVDITNGKPLWEEGSKFMGSARPPLPLVMADGRLVYALKETVRAVDPATNQPTWNIEGLGKISWLHVYEDLLLAIGDDNAAAVDIKTGIERWRVRTYGHTSNLAWDKPSDTIIYTDGKGLHTLERATGKSLLGVPLQNIYNPVQVILASPDAVVLVSTDETAAYNFKSGKQLFLAGKLTGYFRPFTLLGGSPISEDPLGFLPSVEPTSEEAVIGRLRKNSLLPSSTLDRIESDSNLPQSQIEAFETEPGSGATTTWWLDPLTDRQIQFHISDNLHVVNRPLGMVFAVNAKQLWAADLHPK